MPAGASTSRSTTGSCWRPHRGRRTGSSRSRPFPARPGKSGSASYRPPGSSVPGSTGRSAPSSDPRTDAGGGARPSGSLVAVAGEEAPGPRAPAPVGRQAAVESVVAEVLLEPGVGTPHPGGPRSVGDRVLDRWRGGKRDRVRAGPQLGRAGPERVRLGRDEERPRLAPDVDLVRIGDPVLLL